MKEMKWNDLDSLPMDVEQIKKIIILYEGKDDETLNVSTNFWHVFFDARDFTYDDLYDKKIKMNDGQYAYGRFGDRKMPINKIKAWMYADELINLYKNERE